MNINNCNIYFILLCFLLSCKKEKKTIKLPIINNDCTTQRYKDSIAIENNNTIHKYILDNNLVVDSTSTGLFYAIVDSGVGLTPNDNSYITVYYKGYLVNGTNFDQTSGTPIEIKLLNTILGWRFGLPLIKNNGKIKLIIPSVMAYGCNQVANIPKNSVLIFDVELVNIR